jgi:hypothetical protein
MEDRNWMSTTQHPAALSTNILTVDGRLTPGCQRFEMAGTTSVLHPFQQRLGWFMKKAEAGVLWGQRLFLMDGDPWKH